MQISDFKLALNGQIYDSEGLLYSYPEKITQLRAAGQYPAWINALQSDSRFLRELVNPGGECFSIRYSQEGLFYSFTKYNPHDSRNGVVSIALYTQNKAVSDARQLMNVLRNLMDYFLEKNSVIGISDADVENLLRDIIHPYSIQLPTGEAASSLDAYRVYQTEDELQKWLYCAIQKEYTHYRWVHFISAVHRKAVINPTLFSELNGRVAECYAIKRGEGYELALGGTNCSLSFTREGYMPQKVTFTVGQPSQYVTIDANHVIHPKSVNELGLTFKKKVTILLFDESSNMPIVEDGRQICITEELMENTPKRVFLVAEGYRSKTITLDPSKIAAAEGNVRQTLQRDMQNFKPGKNNQAWNNDEHEEGASNKKLAIFVVIALLIGAALGFGVQKFVLAGDAGVDKGVVVAKDSTITVLQDSIKKLNDRGAEVKSQIDKLCLDTAKQNATIRDLNRKLKSNAAKEEKKAEEDAAKKAEQNALEYLQTNDRWCLFLLKNKSDNQNKYYKALEILLTKKQYKLDDVLAVLEPVKDKNPKWKEVVDAIADKKKKGKKEPQIIGKIFESNTDAKTQHPENGTIDLNTLKNKLVTFR